MSLFENIFRGKEMDDDYKLYADTSELFYQDGKVEGQKQLAKNLLIVGGLTIVGNMIYNSVKQHDYQRKYTSLVNDNDTKD